MRNLKKALALALASVMLMGMMVVGTSATFTDVDKADNVEAIEVLEAVEVMIGADGKFNPDKNVTRNEFAVIMTNLLDLDTDAYSGTTPFTDVPAWAEPFVAACYANGIVTGTSATTYGGDNGVTAAQAALMVMKALGYFQYASDFGADWQLATVKQADKIDLFYGIDTKVTATLTRNEAAQLVLNALCTGIVEADDNGIGLDANGNLVSKYSYVPYVVTDGTDAGYATKIDATQVGGAGGHDYVVQLGEDLFDGKLEIRTGGADGIDNLKRASYSWYFDNKKVGEYAVEADHTFVIDSTTGTKAALATWVEEINDATAYVTSAGTCTIYVNGGTDAQGVYAPKIGDVVEVYENAAGTQITSIVVRNYELAKITKVDTNISTTDKENDVTCKVTLKNAQGTQIAILNDTAIAGFDAETYVKDAYLAVAMNAGDTAVLDSYVVTAAATGSVSAYKADTTYTIAGQKFTAVKTTGCFVEAYREGDYTGTYAAYTDANGLLIGIVEIKASQVANDAVYVAKLYKDDTTNTYGEKVETYYAQVVDMNGVVSELVVGYTTVAGKIYGCDDNGTAFTANGSTWYVKSADGSIGTGNAASEAYDPSKLYGATANAIIVGQLYNVKNNEADKYYTLTSYTNATDATYDVGAAANLGTTTAIKTTDTKLGSYYVNADTKYIVIEGNGSAIDVTVKTGGLSYAGTDKTATVIYTTSGSANVAAYVILPVDAYAAGVSEDVLYIKSYDGVVDGGYAYTVYTADGTTKSIVADASGLTVKGAFYKYTVNTKGVYTLSGSTAISIVGDVNIWDGTVTAQTGTDIAACFVSSYNGLLTVGNVTASQYTMGDIKTTKAVIIDLHEKDNDEFQDAISSTSYETYSGAVESLEAMDAADEAGYNIELDFCVTADGATLIFVKNVYRSAV